MVFPPGHVDCLSASRLVSESIPKFANRPHLPFIYNLKVQLIHYPQIHSLIDPTQVQFLTR